MPETRADQSSLYVDLSVAGQTLRLHPDRYAEWREEKTIFIADAHLGKIAHFRRAGFNLPGEAGGDTFSRLSGIMEAARPERLVILGDLFHSDFNEDFLRFADWREKFPQTDVWLIPGNHDLAGRKHLHSLGIRIEEPCSLGPFFLRHEPDETDKGFLLCGHLHPAVSISGKGRQHLRVPAFWYNPAFLCLPAFGTFTGTSGIIPESEDVFYAIAGITINPIPARIL